MSNADGTSCPKCQKTNPIGAKFCSGCATNLGVAPTPPPGPMPPPPPRPGGGGAMMGRFGGKASSRQFNGDLNALFASALHFVEQQDGSEVKHQAAPQQINADLLFKDFMTTLNAPIKVDTEIQLSPSAPGQCNVSVNAKVDWSSTTSIWVFTLIGMVVAIIINPMFFFLVLLFGAILTGMTIWMLSTKAPAKVADDLFEYLRSHAGEAVAQAPVQPSPSHQQGPPRTTPQSPEPTPSEEKPEEEPMERIKKLAELKELGAITEEEFEQKKAELLKRI